MRYTHFSKTERLELSVLLKKGYSLRAISSAMGRSPSSVSREIGRNSVNSRYDARKAAHKAYVKRRYSKYQGMKVREQPELEAYIEEKMGCRWSPDRIAGRWHREHPEGVAITPKGIYKYLYSQWAWHLCRYLKYKRSGKRMKRGIPDMRGVIRNRIFIDQRPLVVTARKRFGDFEGDTMGRPRHASAEILVVVRERKSRYLLALKVPQLKYTIEGFKALLAPVPVQSLTLDNGVENARHDALGITTYFCHPFCSWEKGSVEQGIGLIREHIPKKADLKDYSQERIDGIVKYLNSLPMRCLGYRTPQEVFEEQLSLTTPQCCT